MQHPFAVDWLSLSGYFTSHVNVEGCQDGRALRASASEASGTLDKNPIGSAPTSSRSTVQVCHLRLALTRCIGDMSETILTCAHHEFILTAVQVASVSIEVIRSLNAKVSD